MTVRRIKRAGELAADVGRGLASDLAELVGRGACAACGEPLSWVRGVACGRCRSELSRFAARCDACSLPVAAGTSCPRHARRSPRWPIHAPWPHEGGARRLVRALKQGRRPEVATELARRLLADRAVREAVSGADVLVPLPAHPLRRRERGFDQSLLLATELSAGVAERPRVVNALRRRVGAGAQASLSAAARRRALAGALVARRGAARSVGGRRVVIVDDVVTTGASVRAAARWLRRMGAADVAVVACTRARLPSSTRGRGASWSSRGRGAS